MNERGSTPESTGCSDSGTQARSFVTSWCTWLTPAKRWSIAACLTVFVPIHVALRATFYALCALGAVIPPGGAMLRPLRIFPMFAGMNLALLVGFWLWLRGQEKGIWNRTARSPNNPLNVARDLYRRAV